MSNSNELANKGAFKFKPQLSGLAAKKAAAIAENPEVAPPASPSTMEHRIGIVFDDSASMSSTMPDARAGVEEFLRSCTRDKTAVAVYPMNATELQLSTNLPAIAIMVKSIEATGGTPLVQRLDKMLRNNNLTRAIVFSDGSPQGYAKELYDSILEKKIPVDTVYISGSYTNSSAENFMRELAEKTGGVYLKFDASKSNFRTAFKYLSSGLRYMLADKSFVESIQK